MNAGTTTARRPRRRRVEVSILGTPQAPAFQVLPWPSRPVPLHDVTEAVPVAFDAEPTDYTATSGDPTRKMPTEHRAVLRMMTAGEVPRG